MKIKQDIHVHTNLSLCASRSVTAEDYIKECTKYGIEAVGFADHLWDELIKTDIEFYKPQGMARILEMKAQLEKEKHDGVRVLVGAETEYDYERRGVAITPESAAKLDFLLVPNSHTHITMPKEFYDDKNRHAKYMLDAWFDIVSSDAAPYITSIAHPFFAVCCPYNNRELFPLISDDDFNECFSAAKEKNIAVEINSACYPGKISIGELVDDPSLRMYEIAKKCGCKFTFGTDAHCVEGMNTFERLYTICTLCGIGQDDILEI